MDNTKVRLRREMKAKRSFKPSQLDFTELLNSPEFISARVIASYRSFGDEPVTDDLNQKILDSGKTLLLPALCADQSLEFRVWNGDRANLTLNGNLVEPIGPRFNEMIDLMIVPALAIDKSGNRLGRGGGSYDRALREHQTFSIALINAEELLEEIPTEAHDERVSAVFAGNHLTHF